MRYRLTSVWSAYAHFAEGFRFPPSTVFEVPGGNILTPPKATLAKAYEVGSVLKRNRWTLDVDAYYTHFQNAYDSYVDPATLETVFTQVGPSNTKGIEAEGNVALGHGFSLYANATFASAKYQEGTNFPNGGLWVQDAPNHVFGFSPLWQHRNWDVGVTEKVIGRYYIDNSTRNFVINGVSLPFPADQAVKISPWDLTNFFINYRIKDLSHFRGSKIQFAVNNLANHHSLVGITPANGPTAASLFTPAAGDLLNLLPGRSVTITITAGFAPRR
jgi:iron complex outermembrane receptor protein